ncbi:hypothetical protein [Lactiplantibacillus songbeiensis]|uniref:Integral membrane protein n=1 Tax=Lactiplantibacillus songbeiensis TaxID=2559920 RepID=A0ABW4C0T0_9LACO|nr:hypothetical protein [Lactiplantibacillus songbeiensis]
MKQLVINYALVLGNLLGLPAVFAWLLTVVNRQTKRNLVTKFGINSQVYLGCLGIIIHETSHLIMALIFRHGIQSVRLLKLPHVNRRHGGDDDLALGYVNHTWNQHSFYQTIGNLFIGVAPIFGCTASLLGLDYLLFPGLAHAILKLAAKPMRLAWTASWSVLTQQVGNWWQLLLLLLLTVLIVIGGFDLSPADYQNSALGLSSTIVVLVVFTTIITLLDAHATVILQAVTTFGLTMAIILSYSLVVSLLVMLITRFLRA